MGRPDPTPYVTVPMGDVPRRVQFVYPYYECPRFFETQLDHWAGYPEELRRCLSVVVVDDGSPDNPAAIPAGYSVSIRLFRIEVDVRWNWIAARNIGAHYSPPMWLVLTDMDHVVPVETLRKLVYGDHLPGAIYRFERREHTGAAIHPHPNSWFMTRDMFWKIGGYDEAVSGFYGTDGDYRRRCAATAPVVFQSGFFLERHEYVGDSSTTRYKRKQPEDAEGKRIMKNRPPDWSPRVLSFPHHEVSL